MTVTRALPGFELAGAIADLHQAAGASPDPVTHALERLTERGDTVAVPYSDAARQLGVSVPTVVAWTRRGVLAPLAGVAVRSVTASSLGRVMASLNRIKDLNPTKRQLMQVIEDLRSRDLLAAAMTVVAEDDAAGLVATPVTAEELAEL